ncbi:molybdopterin binding domain-containing protein [Cryptococcus deuterogattii MMRL2647]|nr:molybdopterin binding domain-containing protein [Cryptococcus deuterogattii MMRL2647]
MSTEAPIVPTSPSSVADPLGKGKYIQTAGCIIIGDEVLNGKTKDTNSNFFAQYCFDLGIELFVLVSLSVPYYFLISPLFRKRIEVIADDEDEIIEAARRMTEKYDFVITSGGIGPTHDDITYASLAKAFNLPLVHHPETLRRMWALTTPERRAELEKATPAQREARERMALFPTQKEERDVRSEAIFVEADKWVPVVRLAGRLCVFPGIPALFQQLLLALTPYLPLPPASSKPFRHLIYTSKPESAIAPYLTELQARVKKEGIRIGSYPYLYQGVHVSLIGHNVERIKELGREVIREVDGKVVAEGKLGDDTISTAPKM